MLEEQSRQMALEAGQVVDGKYRIVRLIGEGGMGAVYEGQNARIHRRVAIKVLNSAAAANEETVRRFEREAQAAGRIGSDHILEVLDLGTLEDGDRYMVLEFLDGETLSARIERLGRLEPAQLVPLVRQALAGLAAAHEAGIIHRDLKPDNIFILKEKAGKPDFVKIIDFGISKFSALGSDEMHMTRTGTIMGTPYYMSPEQAKGASEADPRSDIYAMGVIMYEAVTGRVPFDAKTFNELLFQIVLADPAPARQFVPDLNPAFESIIAKAMAREVAHRFQSAAELSAALDNWETSGAAVTVPPDAPEQDRITAAIPPAPAGPAEAGASPQTVGAKTASTWATSQADVAGLPKKPPALILAATAAGVLVLAGGLFAVLGGGASEAPASAGEPAAAEASASAAAAASAPPEEKAPAPKVEPVTEESAEAEDEKKDPEERPGETKAQPPKQPTAAPAPKPAATGAKAQPAAPTRAPRAASPKTTPKAPAPKSSPSKPKFDFGY